MVANQHFTRVDTLELRGFIYRKIGKKRGDEYFDLLEKFLSFKLNKGAFDESCIQTIGKENIPLHNRLIKSILKNACQAKIPPQKPQKVEGPSVRGVNGYQRTCMQSLYGDAFPQSPRKTRSPLIRDRKIRDRPSPLGPLGKSPSVTIEETVSIQEANATCFLPLNSRPLVEVAMVEDGEEVEQIAGKSSLHRWSQITAPIDVSVNTRTSHEAHDLEHRMFVGTCQNSGELPDTESLRSCLQERLASEGVDVSLSCVDLLNKSLDVYLKRLLEPCLAIAGSYSNSRSVSGMNGILQGRPTQRSSQSKDARMLDFRIAMELNPSLLGHHWPTQLDKISTFSSNHLTSHK